MGTFVNNDFTSKLIIISSSSNFKSITISTKCVEFFTYESVLSVMQKHDAKGSLIALGSKVGSLYYLDHESTSHQAALVEGQTRRSTKSLQHITPVEAWAGEKPDVRHSRVFGCTAYAHVPKDERHKLDPKARKWLGYGSQTNCMTLHGGSRDVIFNELEVEA